MIRLDGVTKRYSTLADPVVDNLNLTIEAGETLVLLGASGGGKTTVLKLIDRLIAPDQGVISIDGRDIRELDGVRLRRSIGHVFQQPCLFPHLSVAQNIGLLLKLDHVAKKERLERIDELLETVGLDPALYRDRYPDALSGGQAQRVGVARALALNPKIMLMDEPFGALDPFTRKHLQEELKRLRRLFGMTIVFVTHDMLEALNLGDRIAVMNRGRIEQLGQGEELVQRPATPFVEEFIAKPFAEIRRLAEGWEMP